MLKRLLSKFRRPRGPEPLNEAGDPGRSFSPRASPAAAPGRRGATKTAAGLCGIRPDMGPDEVRQQLAKLYRRYNRAAASLNPEVREEAEVMLDAIIEVRRSLDG